MNQINKYKGNHECYVCKEETPVEALEPIKGHSVETFTVYHCNKCDNNYIVGEDKEGGSEYIGIPMDMTGYDEGAYYRGHEIVYTVNYCTGEVGNLRWHIDSLYKTEIEADEVRDKLLKETRDLREEYKSKFNKDFKDPVLVSELVEGERMFLFLNGGINKTNVVSSSRRIENSVKT
jgi:hypothetical protein